MKVVLLKEGVHTRSDVTSSEYGWRIDPICSSVTLIKAENPGENNILVDTGNNGYEDEIIQALEKEGLKPDAIDYVINTHEHFDHCANNYLFKNAKKIINTLQWNQDSTIDVFKSIESIKIQEGVSIIQTPGHKKPHCSVVVKTDDIIYVIAGDIIAKDFTIYPFETDDKIRSALKVLEIGDVIIPGHGPIIQEADFPELRKKIKEKMGGMA